MPFTASWRTLLNECDALAADATLIMPLSEMQFRLTDVQDRRIIESGNSQPLQREQFGTLVDRITDAGGTFDHLVEHHPNSQSRSKLDSRQFDRKT